MKNWQVFFGVVLGIIFSGIIILISQQPHGKPLELKPLPTSGSITIHISGAIKTPGLYVLPNPSRIEDAILAAGGFSGYENLESINLAALLSDGQKIQIPSVVTSATEKSLVEELDQATKPVSGEPPRLSYPININTAPPSVLEMLPGIGPSKALQIVLFRQEHGLFKAKEDLLKVAGIGQVTFDKLKDLICVSDMP